MTYPVYCDDWCCPSRWTCLRFWGAAQEYWAFDVDAPVEIRRSWRNQHLTSCMDYRRAEAPRSWLAGAFEPFKGTR